MQKKFDKSPFVELVVFIFLIAPERAENVAEWSTRPTRCDSFVFRILRSVLALWMRSESDPYKYKKRSDSKNPFPGQDAPVVFLFIREPIEKQFHGLLVVCMGAWSLASEVHLWLGSKFAKDISNGWLCNQAVSVQFLHQALHCFDSVPTQLHDHKSVSFHDTSVLLPVINSNDHFLLENQPIFLKQKHRRLVSIQTGTQCRPSIAIFGQWASISSAEFKRDVFQKT